MTYDQQILNVLLQAGDRGLSVQAIVKHVYNMNRTFFQQPDYEELHNYVQQYLLKNSKSAQSLIENAGQRGRYRLNTSGSQDAQQLVLQFRDEPQDDAPVVPQKDLSLSLFDFDE